MPSYYADTSALVKRHVNEQGAAWIQDLLTIPDQTVATARISMAEVYSALNRRVREASLSVPTYTAIVADFNALCGND